MRLQPTPDHDDWRVLQDALRVAGDPAADAIDDALEWAALLAFDAHGLAAALPLEAHPWLRWIPPGHFMMGADGGSHEGPAHRVELPAGFWLGAVPVTQQVYAELAPLERQRATDPRLPVEQVSWLDVRAALATLTARVGGDWRLPTEAEWEYACVAGSTETRRMPEVSPYAPLFTNRPTAPMSPVGAGTPNGFGLFDMLGGVREWCYDQHLRAYTDAGSTARGISPVKGGALELDGDPHPAMRFAAAVNLRRDGIGFRLALGDASLAAQRIGDTTGRLAPPETLTGAPELPRPVAVVEQPWVGPCLSVVATGPAEQPDSAAVRQRLREDPERAGRLRALAERVRRIWRRD